jgi:UDP-glucose 6-dehydrogenase
MIIKISGFGYVGMYSAILFSQKHQVIGIDIYTDKLSILNL